VLFPAPLVAGDGYKASTAHVERGDAKYLRTAWIRVSEVPNPDQRSDIVHLALPAQDVWALAGRDPSWDQGSQHGQEDGGWESCKEREGREANGKDRDLPEQQPSSYSDDLSDDTADKRGLQDLDNELTDQTRPKRAALSPYRDLCPSRAHQDDADGEGRSGGLGEHGGSDDGGEQGENRVNASDARGNCSRTDVKEGNVQAVVNVEGDAEGDGHEQD
jgi:hypothetical protein